MFGTNTFHAISTTARPVRYQSPISIYRSVHATIPGNDTHRSSYQLKLIYNHQLTLTILFGQLSSYKYAGTRNADTKPGNAIPPSIFHTRGGYWRWSWIPLGLGFGVIRPPCPGSGFFRRRGDFCALPRWKINDFS